MIEISNGLYQLADFKLTIDIKISSNSITAVLGPSGAGKSTLLNIISGFEGLKQGQLLIDGKSVTDLRPHERPLTAVFQDNNCFAHLSAWQNVALGIQPSLRLTTMQSALVESALQRVELLALGDRLPGEMSGGERQRIGLARALVRQQSIILLDEAFAALGPALRRSLLNLTRELQKEQQLLVLMVTHQPEDAKLVADHVVFIDEGVVRSPVTTAKFFEATDDAVSSYLGDVT